MNDRSPTNQASGRVVPTSLLYEPFNERLPYLERELLKARKYLEERGLNKRVERQ